MFKNGFLSNYSQNLWCPEGLFSKVLALQAKTDMNMNTACYFRLMLPGEQRQWRTQN